MPSKIQSKIKMQQQPRHQPRVPFQPSDDAILERSSVWINFMEDKIEEEDMKDFDWREIESDSQSKDEDENSESNDEQKNNCDADCFEGSSSTDEFDDDQFINDTLSNMKERHRKMEENGIYKALESFDRTQIKNIVVPFIEKNKLDESNSTLVEQQILHIEEHHHRYHDTDSDDSVDTANYIKKNRNKMRPSCSTTTIKKFSYIKGLRRRQKSRGCNNCEGNLNLNRDLASVFQRNFPKNIGNQNCGVDEMSAKRVRSRNMKRRSDITKRSEKLKRSMSSTSTESYSSAPHTSRRGPKHRKKTAQKKDGSVVDLTTMNSSSDPDQTISNKKSKKPTAALDQKKLDETGFLTNNVINSTSVPDTQHIPIPTKACNISQIQKSARLTTAEKPRVLLYRPLEQTTSNEYEISITTEEFQKAVGLINSRRYLYLFSKKMPYKCSSKTTLYFELPPESAASDLSDDDWFHFVGRTGRFIEEN